MFHETSQIMEPTISKTIESILKEGRNDVDIVILSGCVNLT
jgi:hypothetical protein